MIIIFLLQLEPVWQLCSFKLSKLAIAVLFSFILLKAVIVERFAANKGKILKGALVKFATFDWPVFYILFCQKNCIWIYSILESNRIFQWQKLLDKTNFEKNKLQYSDDGCSNFYKWAKLLFSWKYPKTCFGNHLFILVITKKTV